MTDKPNTTPSPQSVPDRGADGRFVRGNRAAYVHGLRARAKREVGGRNRRVNDLLRKYQALRADQGRPLPPALLPLARRFCELETLTTDLHAVVRQDPTNRRALESYFAAVRALTLITGALGETSKHQPVTKPRSVLAEIAEASERERRALLEAHRDDDE